MQTTKQVTARLRSFLLLSGLIFFCVYGCSPSGQEATTTEDQLPGNNQIPDKGLNMNNIAALLDSIEHGEYPNRHSLLIYKNDSLLVEKYFPGEDEIWGETIGMIQHTDTVLHDMRSVSKSVVSACIGIAIDMGMIESADQSIFDFFGEYNQFKKDGRENLTIEHFLTMTSGLEWNEDLPYSNPENSEIQMDESNDRIGFVLSRKIVSTPGSEWNYNGGTTEVLAEIIKKVSGQNVHEFAKKYLFGPIGITRSEWTNSTGSDSPAAASGLRLTSRDMLKFGILYQKQGMFNEKQIIPESWVESSLTSHIDRPSGGGYGYQFWILNFNDAHGGHTIPTAIGNGDQRIFLDSENDMIVVTTAGNYNQWDIEKNAWSLFATVHNSIE